ncbi:MAG: hypothetical protein OEW05_06210 [Candidatus Aminicenantes bacterium]|nr:hypothetical protein [Candidatus Aminicenantes bacterium]
MSKKSLLAVGILLAFLAVTSCSSKPEQSLLKSYFSAVRMNDTATMSSMALEPITVEVASWRLTKAGEEAVLPAVLPELNTKEAEAKKALEQHIGPTMDAKDALDTAQEELDLARTGGAKAQARKKVEELQAAYDQIYALHKDMQKAYNDTKAAAAKEEEITRFSLGVRELANIRDLTGNVHSKEVEVVVTSKAGVDKGYRIQIRRYLLRDEALNLNHNGRWVIVRFDPLEG